MRNEVPISYTVKFGYDFINKLPVGTLYYSRNKKIISFMIVLNNFVDDLRILDIKNKRLFFCSPKEESFVKVRYLIE